MEQEQLLSVILNEKQPYFKLQESEVSKKVTIHWIELINGSSLNHYPALTLTVLNEETLFSWSDELINYLDPVQTQMARLNKIFPVNGHLTIGITAHNELFSFEIKIFYQTLPVCTN